MKKETLEEVANKYVPQSKKWTITDIFIDGAKWQQKISYSEEDLREAFKESRQAFIFEKDMPCVYDSFEKWFEQFKKK